MLVPSGCRPHRPASPGPPRATRSRSSAPGRSRSIRQARATVDSAAVTSQLFESLTAIDATLQTRPALAESWEFRDGGATVVFHLRPGLTFSDGSPLTADDVVRSWRRLIDPAHPSPLVSLIGDVQGALAYAHGQSSDPASVGLSASGNDVTVHLSRPATDFPAIVAWPTFGIVPPGIDDSGGLQPDRSSSEAAATSLTSDDPTDDDADREQPLLGRAAGA